MKHRIHIRIRDLRKERSLTQEGLADQLGISRQTVIALESGRCLPSLPLALQIAGIFGRPMEQIFLMDEALAQEMMRAHELMESEQMLLAAEATVPVAVDVYRLENDLIVEALVPGFTKEDITVEIESNRLILSGERTLSEEGDEYLARELAIPSRFSRTLSLPVDIDTESVTAEVNDGLLRIKAPLMRRGPQKITIS